MTTDFMDEKLPKFNYILQFNRIIKKGQERLTPKRFTKRPKKYLQTSLEQIFLPVLAVFLVTAVVYYLTCPALEASPRYKETWNVFFEIYKIVMGASTGFLVTIFLTNRRQLRAYSFEMVKELNSKEFMQIRNNLSSQMKEAMAGKKDLDDAEPWFPFNRSYPVHLEVNATMYTRQEGEVKEYMNHFSVVQRNMDITGGLS